MTIESEPNTAAAAPSESLAGAVGESWRSFLQSCEALRPELYRYCRYLTRSPWDADDWCKTRWPRPSSRSAACTKHSRTRAPVTRWRRTCGLNRVRGQRELPHPAPWRRSSGWRASRAARDARTARTLLRHLAPQERAAVVLKDVFNLSLEEIPEGLSTSVGAVKAALHRGRKATPTRLKILCRCQYRRCSKSTFCEAFNARDLNGLTALLLDTVVSEFPGLTIEYSTSALQLTRCAACCSATRRPIQPNWARISARVCSHARRGSSCGCTAANRYYSAGFCTTTWSCAPFLASPWRVTISRMATYMHTPHVLAGKCARS